MLSLILGVALAGQTVQVIVTARELDAGDVIRAEDLQPFVVPPDYVPNAVLRSPEQAVGRTVLEPILKHEYVREERLADPEAAVGPTTLIPRGMRMTELALDPPSAAVRSRDIVDVATVLDSGPCVALSAVLVMGVRGPDGAWTNERLLAASDRIYLALTPQQVGTLKRVADPALLVRNPVDFTPLPMPACPSADAERTPR